MKSTVVDERLSTNATRVLFQRETTLLLQLDGCYTCMLRAVHNIHWSDHISNKDLYGSLPKLSEKLKQCRLRFAGHCHRHSEEAVSRLVLWTQHMANVTEGNLQSPMLTS